MVLYLQDVALLNGHVLQLTGFLLQTQCRAADCKIVHDLLWDQQSALTQLHCLHLLLEAIHICQQALDKTHTQWQIS